MHLLCISSASIATVPLCRNSCPWQSIGAYWTTEEHRQHFRNFWIFFVTWRKLPGMAPNWAGKVFFRLIQTMPTFWATWIWILRIFMFDILWDSKFLDFQVPRFPKSGPAQPAIGSPTVKWQKKTQQTHIVHKVNLVSF